MKRYPLPFGVSGIVISLTLAATSAFATPPSRPLKDVIGVVHANSKYTTDNGATDSLNEGVGRIATLGSSAVKLWLNRNVQNSYPNFTGTATSHPWPAPTNPQGGYNTPLEVVQLPYYEAALQDPRIKTYVLETFLFTNTGNPTPVDWLSGITETQEAAAYNQVLELAKHLIETYRNTGKTFILSNWEGDNDVAAMQTGTSGQQTTAINSMIAYMQQRQSAVEEARDWADGLGYTNVHVYHAFEVNELPTSPSHVYDYPLLIDEAVPYVQCDLYSYSCWQSIYLNQSPQILYQVNYMRSRTPTAGILGADNIYIGEYGSYEHMWFPNGYEEEQNKLHHDSTSDSQFALAIRQQTDCLLRTNPRHIFFWSLYGTGFRTDASKPTNPVINDSTFLAQPMSVTEEYLAGTWLIRPPGRQGGVTNYQGFVPTPDTSSTYTYTEACSDLQARMRQFAYYDELTGLNYVASHTSGLAIATTAPTWAEGDTSRLYRTTGSANQSIIYYLAQNPGSPNPDEEISEWNLKAYLFSTSASPGVAGKLRGYLSADGVNWSSPFAFAESDPVQPDPENAPTWYRLYLHAPATFPAGFTTKQKYLKVEWYGTPELGAYELQLGSAQIITDTLDAASIFKSSPVFFSVHLASKTAADFTVDLYGFANRGGGFTWQSGDYSGGTLIGQSVVSANTPSGWLDLDVTEFVNQQVSAGNVAIVFKLQIHEPGLPLVNGQTNNYSFRSADYGDGSFGPSLTSWAPAHDGSGAMPLGLSVYNDGTNHQDLNLLSNSAAGGVAHPALVAGESSPDSYVTRPYIPFRISPEEP